VPTSQNRILKIGITGGIGSGKSTLCSAFMHLGVPVLFADDIAKELSVINPVIRKKLTALLGNFAYQSDGSLNKQFIASVIFSDESKRKKMEAIIHAQVEKEIDKRIKELANKKQRMVIVEAALIYEAGLDNKLDTVIVIDSDEAERINRVRKRDVVSEESVRSRISTQLDVKKKLEKADYVIINNGTTEDLEIKARFLYTIFSKLASEDKSG
jgi:dephospho-CoA kinase